MITGLLFGTAFGFIVAANAAHSVHNIDEVIAMCHLLGCAFLAVGLVILTIP